VRALQGGNTPSEDNGGSAGSDAVAAWKQPTGAHDAYMIGDKMLYTDGKVYKSLIDNNVWSPDVYPNGWAEEE
jgi:hypothetical protein